MHSTVFKARQVYFLLLSHFDRKLSLLQHLQPLDVSEELKSLLYNIKKVVMKILQNALPSCFNLLRNIPLSPLLASKYGDTKG